MAQQVAPLDSPLSQEVEAENTTTRDSWLERPLSSVLAISWETIAWIIIFAAGVLSRFVMLGTRSMTHDESLHALYSYYLYANGNYDHNPMMHGPFLFHMNALAYFLFGDSDFTARIVPALMGLGVLGMIYLFRPYLGRIGAIVAGILVVISPALLFHSRYIRNDIYIAFFTLVWIYGAFRFLDLRQFRYLVIMVLGMAFGFITKEVHFMHGAIIGAFFGGLALWQVANSWVFAVISPLILSGGAWYYFHNTDNDLFAMIAVAIGLVIAGILLILALRGKWGQIRRNPAADMTVIMLTMVMPFLAPFIFVYTGGDAEIFMASADYSVQPVVVQIAIMVGVCLLAAIGIGMAWFWRRKEEDDGPWQPTFVHWALLMGIFWVIQILFFTTFFTNTLNGLASGIVGSLGYWMAQQDVKRGNQPVYYYVLIGWLYEFLPAILSLGGILAVGGNLLRGAASKAGWDPVAPHDLPGASKTETELRIADPVRLRRNRRVFIVFAVFWVAASWIAYSIAGEKMPWLLVHIALPMCVLGGWWFGHVLSWIDWRTAWRNRSWALVFVVPLLGLLLLAGFVILSGSAGTEASTAGRILQGLLVIGGLITVTFLGTYGVVRGGWIQGLRLLVVGFVSLLFVLTMRTSFLLNYVNYDMATEYLVYAHGTPDIKRALAEIEMISERTVGARNVEVAYDDDSSWPMTWYMRLFPNSRFYGENPTTETMSAPVVIVGPKNRAKVEPYMARDYVKRTYRRMWWPEMDYFDLTPERLWGAIADPAQRERILQIVAFRKYRDPNDLSKWRDMAHWPYQGEFDMYVRRDLAADIWDLNVLPVTSTAPDVPMIGPEQIRDVTASQVYLGDYNGLPLFTPRSVAIGPGGIRVLADTGNHRIVVLDANGQLIRTFGSYCNLGDPANTPCQDPDGNGLLQLGDGQFYEPWGVAVDPQGQIYVADTWNGRIQVFDAEGNFLRKWGQFATTDGDLGDAYALFGPRGLAIDLDGNLVVADTGNKRILVYTPDGEALRQIGGGGVVAGRFDEPTDVAVDPTNGTILVADAWNQRIQRFSSELEFQGEYPVPGWTGRDIYQKPFLDVGADGVIYVGDPASGQIIAFNGDGSVKYVFGGIGETLNRIGLPNGLAADLAAQQLLVADGGNNRVMVFAQPQE